MGNNKSKKLIKDIQENSVKKQEFQTALGIVKDQMKNNQQENTHLTLTLLQMEIGQQSVNQELKKHDDEIKQKREEFEIYRMKMEAEINMSKECTEARVREAEARTEVMLRETEARTEAMFLETEAKVRETEARIDAMDRETDAKVHKIETETNCLKATAVLHMTGIQQNGQLTRQVYRGIQAEQDGNRVEICYPNHDGVSG